MDAQTCMQKMKLAGTLAMATVDDSGLPQIRCVSAVHYEPDAVYFFTARGKEMSKQLLADGHLQTMVHTRFNEMIRMSGVARPAPQDEQKKWIDCIFQEQPYLANVYPGETRSIGIVYKISEITFDYFNLGVKPIERGVYTLNGARVKRGGYRISVDCIGCGKCAVACPQKCIAAGDPYAIQQEHCLHCGACAEACPVGAARFVQEERE